MERGDHIYVRRTGYTHHGVYCGESLVVHYTGEVARKSNAAVKETSLAEFADGGRVEVQHYSCPFDREAIVGRARSRLGEEKYDLIFNNCEHFARWCVTCEHNSEQVKDSASIAGGSAGVGAATAGALGIVSAGGSVVGLGGAGTMSGLAAAGGAVGGGALAGLALLGAAPAAAASVAMNYLLEDDPNVPQPERQARQVGRIASYVGGGAGTVGALAAVSTCGTVAGLSGAGITSGLATIGGVIGGGMAAGTAVVIAAPAVAVITIGYGLYRLFR